MPMERIWQLLVAIFILCACIALLLLGYLMGSTPIFAIGAYGSFLGIPIGITIGVLAIIDHHRENKDKE